MQYLLTAKKTIDGKPELQRIVDNQAALNIVRRSMLSIQSMDETSADVKAISFMASVKPTGAKVLENTQNGRVLVVQQCHD
jgi:hypothetical protein